MNEATLLCSVFGSIFSLTVFAVSFAGRGAGRRRSIG